MNLYRDKQMTEAKSKDGFRPCPKCFSEVDVVVVRRNDVVDTTNYFFVNCQICGEGTRTAFRSMNRLQQEWNSLVEHCVT